MYGRKHIHRVAALLTAVAASAFFAGAVQASEGPNRQSGLGSGALVAPSAVAASNVLPPKAIHALGARYEAMAQYYAGASASLPPRAAQALGERYEAMAEHYLGPGSSGYTPPQALRALGERWQAVARYEQQAQLEHARRQAAAFGWADAGVGALAATGVVALLGLGALGLRSRTPGRPASQTAS